MAEKVDVVDENDNIIGIVDKDEAHENGVLHRIVQAIVVNSENKIFIIKRAIARKNGPGLFDSSIGGHVEQGEHYNDAIKREGKEELGVGGNYKFLFKFISEHPKIRHMVSVYLLRHNGPFVLDPRETDEGKWMSYKEALEIPRGKMTGGLFHTLARLKNQFY